MQARQKMQEKIKQTILYLQRFMDAWWYNPVVGLLALVDNFIVVVPTDGILISSSMLKPKRWHYLALCTAIGSTTGAMILAHLIDAHGLPWILQLFPDMDKSQAWVWTEDFFGRFGLFVVFLVAVTPFVQQPAVILATLAHTPMLHLLVIIFTGRLIKYMLMSYLASHAPRLLSKLWGVQSEMQDVGIQLGGTIKQPQQTDSPAQK